MEINPQINSSRILIIDDDVNVGIALEETLKDHDFSMVRYISDSRQTLTVFQEFRPDLIMLDINMPHMDGFEVMELLKKERQASYVPILVLTAQADESMCVKALNAGATDFLDKPMRITEALARIQNMLQVRQLHASLENKNDFLEEKIRDRTFQLRQAIQDLDKMHQEVKKAYIETIYRLTRATEYKDEETADHVRRLSMYASTVGKAIGLNETIVELLLYAAPMHDVGKIGIPDKILFKAENLNPEEWAIMKRHPQIGYEILNGSDSPVLKLGASIALHHHERWDGTGYPKGLKGNAIPIEGRILALVDVYDALRSKRHYKEPYDHEKSCKIILEGDGRVLPTHFDPALLEVFAKIHLEFKKIFDDHSN